MFLCEKCLEDNFKNFAIPFSKGKCEYCDEVKRCVDIPSEYLIEKDTYESTKLTTEEIEKLRNITVSELGNHLDNDIIHMGLVESDMSVYEYLKFIIDNRKTN